MAVEERGLGSVVRLGEAEFCPRLSLGRSQTQARHKLHAREKMKTCGVTSKRTNKQDDELTLGQEKWHTGPSGTVRVLF